MGCGATAFEPSVAVARLPAMSPTWIWMQGAIVVFVIAGAVIAVTKLI
jgi:hypothetical protein